MEDEPLYAEAVLEGDVVDLDEEEDGEEEEGEEEGKRKEEKKEEEAAAGSKAGLPDCQSLKNSSTCKALMYSLASYLICFSYPQLSCSLFTF